MEVFFMLDRVPTTKALNANETTKAILTLFKNISSFLFFECVCVIVCFEMLLTSC